MAKTTKKQGVSGEKKTRGGAREALAELGLAAGQASQAALASRLAAAVVRWAAAPLAAAVETSAAATLVAASATPADRIR